MERSLRIDPLSGASFARYLVRVVSPCAFILACAVGAQKPAVAQQVDPQFPITNGSVGALAMGGDTLFIAGDYSWIGTSNGGMVALDSRTGARITPWPRVLSGRMTGQEYFFAMAKSSIPDGEGGCYVGGSFQTVSGVARSRLAHIRADGSLDGWAPAPNATVNCFARIGPTLFVGGFFSSVNGQPRAGLAAFDMTTGALLPWDAHASASSSVTTLAVDGSRLIVSGYFSSIGGQTRNGLAAVDPVSGLATPWNPNPNAEVNALAIAHGVIYAAGYFTAIGGQSRRGVAALDAVTGLATSWDAGANQGSMLSVVAAGSLVYLSGDFTQLAGTARAGIGAVDATTGAVAAWSPDLGFRSALQIAAQDGVVYLAGNFRSVNGTPRSHLAAVDPVSGALTSWNPGADQPVGAIAVRGSRVFVTGAFAGCGGEARTGLAAVDLKSGQVLGWQPQLDGGARCLAVEGDRLYVGGAFRHVDGLPRGGLAAFDRSSGQLEAWNPGGNNTNTINLLACRGPRVYVSGSIQSIGGSGSRELAALDRTTGLATTWNPTYASTTPYRYLSRLIALPSRVFMGGEFTSVNGQPRAVVAAVDPVTGATLPWNAQAVGYADAMTQHGSTLYFTGRVPTAGGSPCLGIAAVDTGTALATGWSTPWEWNGNALAATDSRVYLGVSGGYLDPSVRKNAVLALNGSTGALEPWFPHVSSTYLGSFTVLEPREPDLYVGGQAEMLVGDEMRAGLARIHPDDLQLPTVSVLSPGAGESLVIDSRRELQWETDDNEAVASCDVYLSRSGPTGPWELLAAAVTGTAHYAWTVSPPTASTDCWLRVDARDYAGNTSTAIGSGPFAITATTGVGAGSGRAGLALGAPLPNPASAEATVSFVLPAAARARMCVVDLQGREVAVLLEAGLPAGAHHIRVPAGGLPPGLYFVSLRVPGQELTRRLAVIR